MTEDREDVRVPQPQQTPPVPPLPRLFSEADGSAVEGAFDGDEGVGAADFRGAGERSLHGGARRVAESWEDEDPQDELSGLLDPDSQGVRGARPASRTAAAAWCAASAPDRSRSRSRRGYGSRRGAPLTIRMWPSTGSSIDVISCLLIVRTTARPRTSQSGNRAATTRAHPRRVAPRVTTSSTIVMRRGGCASTFAHRIVFSWSDGPGRSAPLRTKALFGTAVCRTSSGRTPAHSRRAARHHRSGVLARRRPCS